MREGATTRRGPKLKLDLAKRMEIRRAVKAGMHAGLQKCEVFKTLAKRHNVSQSTIARTVYG